MKLRNLYAGTALALLIVSAGPSWSQDTAQAEAEAQAVNREQVQESVTAETDSQFADKRTALIQEAVDAGKLDKAATVTVEAGTGLGIMVSGGKVNAEILAHGRGEKIRIIKHRRRKHYHKEQGHRQNFTEVKITEIVGA